MLSNLLRPVVSGVVLAATIAFPAHGAGPQNGKCKAVFPENIGTAWLSFKDGKPVGYRTSSGYQAHTVSRAGNTIKIDRARLTVVSESPSAVTGNWKLGGYTTNNLKFACK